MRLAPRAVKLVNALPNTPVGRAGGGQLVRGGTSVGANSRSACRGWYTAEVVARLGTVQEEADESAYWLELLIEGGLLPEHRVEALLQEADELTATMSGSRKTARNAERQRAAALTKSKTEDRKPKMPEGSHA
jgi:four helix bundle protein